MIAKHQNRLPIGPFTSLHQAVLMLNGTINNDLTVSFGNKCLNWIQTSTKTVNRILHRQWLKHVCATRIQRKHFEIADFDAAGNSASYKKLDDLEKSLVDAHFCGAHYTNDFRCKYIPAVTEICPLCDMPDSRAHRLFECAATASLREQHPKIPIIYETWKETEWHFGLCPGIQDVHDSLQRFRNLVPQLVLPCDDHKMHHVFTDGTAFFANVPEYTIAASALVECAYHEKVVYTKHSDIVPGWDQSSYTGELYAILLALNKFHRLTIYTDCQAIYDALQQILHDDVGCKDGKHEPVLLWDPILQHLRSRQHGDLRVIKVKAHTAVVPWDCSLQGWMTWANDQVDKEAKKCVTKKHNRTFTAINGLRQQVTETRVMHAQLFLTLQRLVNFL